MKWGEKSEQIAYKAFQHVQSTNYSRQGKIWGELLLAHTVAELMASHFQIVEALMAGRRADQSACDLSNALKNQWNVQMDGVSRRLEKLEKRRRNPL